MQFFTKVLRMTLFMLCVTLSAGIVLAQERSVSGTVTADNEGLPGVNVYIQGTTVGTITDLDGKYTLQVPGPDAVLVFSSVGFKTQTLTVGSQSVINVTMQAEVTALQEIVVTGYTTQSRANISGSVSEVSPAKLQSVPQPNVGQQLQGRAAGVTVTQDGQPGGVVAVRIRGLGTVNDNTPLYIVDGTPVDEWTMQDLNPNDVASIQVLKDASAASIYGARAANGVIIITTKSGSKGGVSHITFDGYYGVQQPGHLPQMCSPQELANVIFEGENNAGVAHNNPQYGSGAQPVLPKWLIPQGSQTGPTTTADYNKFDNSKAYTRAANTDWLGEIFGPAPMQSYNVGATGGSDKGTYALSAGYFDQQGVVMDTWYKRYSLRANTEFNVMKRLKVGETLALSYTEQVNEPGKGGAESVINFGWRIPSIIPVYDIMGNWAGTRVGGMNNPSNPIANLVNNKDNVSKGLRVLSSAYVEFEPIDGLTLKSSFNSNFGTTFEDKNFGYATYWNAENTGSNSLNQNTYNDLDWTWYNTINYVKSFNDVHNFSLLLGTEAIDDYYTHYGASRSSFFSNDLAYRYLNAGQASQSNSGDGSEWALFSLFAKLDYNYNGRYIFSATVRRDGSSRFGADNRYGVFPAFSAAWRISQESFMQGISFINDLKIRAGWGQTGNQSIGNYLTSDTYSTSQETANYAINGANNSVSNGFQSSVFGNPDVKWETNTSTDIGFDLTAINNQLTVNFDWYDRKTTDMLLQVPVPTLKGRATNPYKNVGEMDNKGIDATIAWNGTAGADVKYSIGLNFTQYKNKLVKMYDPTQIINDGYWREYHASRTQEGQPVGSFYGWKILGIFQTQEEVNSAPTQDGAAPGRWRYADTNGDGVINSDDETFIGSPHPDFTLGIPISVSYKNFDLNMFWYGSFGNDVFNTNKLFWDFNTYFTYSQKGKDILKSWGYPGVNNADALLPQINNTQPGVELEPSTFYVENGTYMRMSQLTLGYNLPKTKFYDKCRVYLQGNNLITMTKYTGIDPEISTESANSSGGDLQTGVDIGQYPVVKSYMIGLNVTF
jgi:TonB-linked SusC/RagA family outer membrane protein